MEALAWIALIALIVGGAQLLYFAKQAKASAEAAKASADGIRASVAISMAQMMIDIDRLFLERPRVRAAFYGQDGHLTEAETQAHESEAAAEILVDFAECFLEQRNYMPDDFAADWESYFRDLMGTSPVFRDFWDKHHNWYSGSVREFLDPMRQAQAV